METRNLVGLGVLVAGILALNAFLMSDRRKPDAGDTPPQLGIGYYLRDATLSGTDTTGHLLYRISAATVTQKPADGSIQMQDVRVNYEPESSIPWSLSAEEGKMLAGGKMISLSGNVVAATRDAGSPAATISTDYLEFDPSTDTATTTSKVVIEYAGSVIHATGMRALLRQDRMELLDDVTGRYVR